MCAELDRFSALSIHRSEAKGYDAWAPAENSHLAHTTSPSSTHKWRGAFNDAQSKAGLNLSRSAAINIQVPQGSEYVNLVLRIIRWSLLCVESLNLYTFEQHIYTKFALAQRKLYLSLIGTFVDCSRGYWCRPEDPKLCLNNWWAFSDLSTAISCTGLW